MFSLARIHYLIQMLQSVSDGADCLGKPIFTTSNKQIKRNKKDIYFFKLNDTPKEQEVIFS